MSGRDVHRARGGGRRRGGGRAARADRPRPNVKFGFFFGGRAAKKNLEGGVGAAAPPSPHF